MIVMKFGGTSVGSAQNLRRVTDIIRNHVKQRPVVVVSAMNGITDLILSAAQAAAMGQEQELKTRLIQFEERHATAIRSLFPEEKERTRLLNLVDRFKEELHRILIGMSYLGDAPPRALDAIVSFGERLLAEILAAYMNRQGLVSRAINAHKLIVTDDHFGAASPLMEPTTRRCRRIILPLVRKGIVPVITGFIGATREGVPTTLGRGGSDYSAALIGAALRAHEIWIYTDVDGVMSSDPKVVPNSRPLEELSYHEVAELAYFGAKVVHPKTVFPAIEHQIPLRIKNTFNPDFPGTRIVRRTSPMNHIVKAISAIGHLSLVTVEGAGMLGVPEMTARVFDTIAREKINVLLITQASSQQSICFVVRQSDAPVVQKALREEFARELRRGDLQRIGVQDGVAIIAVVGEGMRGTPGVAGRLCSALGRDGINIIAIAQGSSERNISLVVSDRERAHAVRSIHKEFIG
ncbi:MAG TPA: aspartate kinase [Blastocatellia bacterium]|nr:aspartate kinase [Blastocatellia bacterium]